MDYKDKKGGLFIELLIVTVLLSLVMIGITQSYVYGRRIFEQIKLRTAIQREAINLTNHIASGLPGGAHGLVSAKDIQTADDSNLIFTDKNNDTIRYYKTGADVFKTINGGSDTQFFDFDDLVDVDSLEFRYYTRTDAQLATPVGDPSQVTKIKVITTLKGKDTAKPDLTLTVSIKPRNLM